MEQKFSNNSIDLQLLREFCEREGDSVFYRKGDQLEREGDPATLRVVTTALPRYCGAPASERYFLFPLHHSADALKNSQGHHFQR